VRFLLKLIAFFIFAPVVLALLAILAIVAIIGLPLLWEELVAKLTNPPSHDPEKTQPA
jgi:hypothetical protein